MSTNVPPQVHDTMAIGVQYALYLRDLVQCWLLGIMVREPMANPTGNSFELHRWSNQEYNAEQLDQYLVAVEAGGRVKA